MRLNDIFDRIVVINLDSRPDRLESFDAQAKMHGIEYTRFPAVTTDSTKRGARTKACRESHRKVIKSALDEEVKRLFVFEDDAQFVEDFNERLENLYNKLPEDWDMFYLGAWHFHCNQYKPGLVKMSESYSAHAYGINTKYMEGAVKASLLNLPIDTALASRHPHIQAYCAKPALVGQAPGFSDIEQEYRDVTDKYL